MPTLKQKKAIANMVEMGGDNMGQAMVEAGYSRAAAKNPRKLTESKGFAELCNDLGLTDELIVGALADDIKAKPKNRVQELSLAAKIKGLEKPSSAAGPSTLNILLQAFGVIEGGSIEVSEVSDQRGG